MEPVAGTPIGGPQSYEDVNSSAPKEFKPDIESMGMKVGDTTRFSLSSDGARQWSIVPSISSSGSSDIDGYVAPSGWKKYYTIRNVSILFNSIILLLTILVLTVMTYLLSYYANDANVMLNANNAVYQARSLLNHTMVIPAIDTLEDFAVDIQDDALSFPNESMQAYLLLRELSTMDRFKAIHWYNASSDSMVTVRRVSSLRNDGEVNYWIGYANSSTNHHPVYYPYNYSCHYEGISCRLMDTTNPPWMLPYAVQDIPWYQQALVTEKASFTPLYGFSYSESALSATLPVFSRNGTFLGIIALDIDLIQFSKDWAYMVNAAVSSSPDIRLFAVSRKPVQTYNDRQCSTVNVNYSLPWQMNTSTPKPGFSSSSQPATQDFIYSSLVYNALVLTNVPSVDMDLTVDGCRITATQAEDPIIHSVVRTVESKCGPVFNVDPSVSPCATMTSGDNQILVKSFFSGDENLQWAVVLVVPRSIYLSRLNRLFAITLPIVVPLVLVIAIVSSVLFTTYVTRPIRYLTKQLVLAGNLDFDRMKPYQLKNKLQLKEVAKISAAMNAMTSGLRSFGKYVPKDVVRILAKMRCEAILGVDNRELTVFFSDIADFTSISEQLDPQLLVHILGEYLGDMSSIIMENDGVVDKFIGDAVMAFWNAPVKKPNHAFLGCEAALQSRERLISLQQRWSHYDYPLLKMRIGLNTGPALVGNLGAPDRMNFTCIGDTVNIANRLETLNKLFNTEILISENTYVCVNAAFGCRLLALVALKGKSLAMRVYELVGRRYELSDGEIEEIEKYNDGMEKYFRREFSEGKRVMEEYLERHPDDIPAKIHFDACEKYMHYPPEKEWCGVMKLTEK